MWLQNPSLSHLSDLNDFELHCDHAMLTNFKRLSRLNVLRNAAFSTPLLQTFTAPQHCKGSEKSCNKVVKQLISSTFSHFHDHHMFFKKYLLNPTKLLYRMAALVLSKTDALESLKHCIPSEDVL